jgi:hypothetical protein
MSARQDDLTTAQRLLLLKRRVQALRTIWWYRFVANELGKCSPHRVGQLATPERYRIDGISHKYRGDWSLYARGVRSPATLTLDQVEAFVPGSAQLYLHPMWSVLKGARRSRLDWAELATSGPIEASMLLTTRRGATLKIAAAAPLCDSMLSLLSLRRHRESSGVSSDFSDIDHLLIQVCLVAAALDKQGLPYLELIRILNLHFWVLGRRPFPFYSLAVFCNVATTIQRCQPRGGPHFRNATDVQRRMIAVQAASGQFGWDLSSASHPIYLCDCPHDCEHRRVAKRDRWFVTLSLRVMRGDPAYPALGAT